MTTRKKQVKSAVRKKKRTFPLWAVEDPESFGMTEKEYLDKWQELVETGQAWTLQGWYGRTASALLEQGLIKFPKKKTTDYYGSPIPTHQEAKKTKLYKKLKKKADMKKAIQNAFGDVATVM
jgi:hypothetical protein